MQREMPALERGFSLLELVLVMGIMGVVAGMAAPRFTNATMRYRVALTARRIAADLGLARSWAKARSNSQVVAFDPAGSGYRMAGVRPLGRQSPDYEVSFAGGPHQVTLVSVDFGGDPNVVFDAYGAPDSGGTVVIQANGTQKTITLDAYTGKATIQ